MTPATKKVLNSILSWIFGFLVYTPAMFFWSTVLMRVALGTDYFFDMVFDSMAQTWWGNLILMIFVVFIPGIGAGIDGLVYIKTRDRIAKWGMAVGVTLLALGFYSLAKRD